MSKNVREVALECLLEVEKNNSYSNLLLNEMIKKHNLNQKDVGLLTEIVYGTIQRVYTLDFYLAPYLKNPKKIADWVKILLRLSVYQLVYLDRVPDRAILFEAVEIAKKRGHKGIAGMVNGVLRTLQREGLPSIDSIKDVVERISIQTSHPEWLVRRWVNQYGEKETEKMCDINLLPPPITARVNSVKGNLHEAIQMLQEEGIEAVQGDLSEDAIKIEKGNIAHTNAFKKGYITVQDESSMLVARALDVEENQHILDSCAAPGGKTTHIAERLNGSGVVYSTDIHKHKIKLINDQVTRIGVQNVKTMVSDSRKLQDHFEKASFDRILVDAPCSGLGVVRRKPDIKYSKTEEDIERLASIQLDILKAVSPLLKEGGVLVYSTCTIDQSENEKVVSSFLEDEPMFTPDETVSSRLPKKLAPYVKNGQVQILPHYFGTDGFFIATFRKKVS